jgi:pre-mRNA-splicing factor SPF27
MSLNLEEYDKVKNYLYLLRAQNEDQKQMGVNFFQAHKNDKEVFECLNAVRDNKKENDDLRMQATVTLKKLYNTVDKYMDYNTSNENEYRVETLSNAILSEEMLRHSDINIMNKGNDNNDALPYLDGVYKDEKGVKEKMEKLLKEEMNKLSPSDRYLSKDPLHKFNFLESDLMKSELERIGKNKKLNVLENEISTRIQNPPPNKFHDSENWEKLINSTQLSIQKLNSKNLNLDLLIKFGPQSWKKYLYANELFLSQLENEKKNLEKICEVINQERKFEQVS